MKHESPERRALRWLLNEKPLRVDSIRDVLTEMQDDEATAELEQFSHAHMRAAEFGNPAQAFSDLVVLVEAGVAMGPKSWEVVKKFYTHVLRTLAARQYHPDFLKRELRELKEAFAAAEELLANHADEMLDQVHETPLIDEAKETQRKEAERKKREFEALSPEMQQRYLVKEALREDPVSTERLCDAITFMENRLVNTEFITWSARAQHVFQQHAFPEEMRKAVDAITVLSTVADQLPLLSWEAVGAAVGRMQQARPWVMEKDRAPYDQAYAAFEGAKTSAPEIRAFWRYAETDAPLHIDDVVQDLHAMPSNAAAQDALNTLVEKASGALINDEQRYFTRTLQLFTALAERRGSFIATEQECIEQGLAQLVQEKKYDDAWRSERALRDVLDGTEDVSQEQLEKAMRGVAAEALSDMLEMFIQKTVDIKDDAACKKSIGVLTYLHVFLDAPQLPDARRSELQDSALKRLTSFIEDVRRDRGVDSAQSEQEREAAARRTKILVRVRDGHFATALPLLIKEFGERWSADPELRQAAKEGIAALLDERLLKVDKVEAFARQCGFAGGELDAVMRVPKRKAPTRTEKKRQQA